MSQENDPARDQSVELSRLTSELAIMAFRLEALEKKFEESLGRLIDKIDELIEKQSNVKEKQSLDSQALSTFGDQVIKLDNKIEELEKEVVSVRISLAEKVLYGGVGGGLVTGVFKLIEFALS